MKNEIEYPHWHAQVCEVCNPYRHDASDDATENQLLGWYREGVTPADAAARIKAEAAPAKVGTCDWQVRKSEADHFKFESCGSPGQICTTGPGWQVGSYRCKKHNKSAPAKAGATPGPWTVANENNHCILAPSPTGCCIVATLPKDGTQVPQTDANARLIASAPELLAALKMFAFKYAPSAPEMSKCRDVARAAIALAEGAPA